MGGNWYFLTNHAHVLLCVAKDPGVRLRDIAESVGITERGAHKVLSQLVEEGYVRREKQGRRNHYEIRSDLPLRHPLVQERNIGELLDVLLKQRRAGPRAGRSQRKAD
jgi:DNA-binding transcriptional ArsR family regulator